MKGLRFSKVEDHHNALTTVEVCRYNRTVLFLARSIPNEQFDRTAVDAYLLYLEVDDRDPRTRLLQKLSLDVTPEKCSLAYKWVAYHDYFEVGLAA